MLLEVGGVGYLVTVSHRTLAELEPSTNTFLYVHHHIREDNQTLYGFVAREERGTFQVLIGTHGIGPALAMAMLATHPPLASSTSSPTTTSRPCRSCPVSARRPPSA